MVGADLLNNASGLYNRHMEGPVTTLHWIIALTWYLRYVIVFVLLIAWFLYY